MRTEPIRALQDTSEKLLKDAEHFVEEAKSGKDDPNRKKKLESKAEAFALSAVSALKEIRDDTGEVQKELAKARDHIARVITWAFVVAVGFALMYASAILFLDAANAEDWRTVWALGVDFISTTISSVMLPVVTLVLGYYFGTKASGH